VRGLISFALVAVTVVFQLTVVDRIAFPGGADPDLVLLVVAALALAGGPLAGVLTGFLAGLALDVAPPGSHFVGQDALVFCLIGYACGLLADDSSGDAEQGHTALFEIVVTAAGAICGEALLALLGVMLSDPRVTWPAITHVLPVAVAYDVLLCPFVLSAAAAALRLAGARGEGRRVGWSASQARTPVPGPNQAGRPSGRREPQFKRGRAGPRTSAGLGAAFAPATLGAGPVMGRARVRFGGSSMGRSLFGGSVFSRSSPFRHRGNLVRPAGGGLAGRAPRFSRGSSLARLTGALRRSAGPKSPGRGWLRGASSRGGSLGRGAFGRRRMGRVPASWSSAGTPRLRMPRQRTKRRWRTGGYR
jgi:rod shape-determining protein MreD